MPSALRLAIGLLLPLLLIGGWLAAEQIPIWTQIRYESIPAADGGAAPAACEAASLLNQWQGRLIEPSGIPSQQAADQARAAFAAQGVIVPEDDRRSLPIGADALIDGERRPIWLLTFALGGPRTDAAGIALPIPAALAVIDAADGSVIHAGIIAAAAVDPAAACPFDGRGALIDLLRSTPFILLAGYLGLTLIVLAGAGVFWFRRRRKGAR